MKSIYTKNLIVTAVIMLLSLTYLGKRYYIGIDSQGEERCLHSSVFIVDRWDTNYEVGDLVVFKLKVGDRELVATKILAGRAGDTIQYDIKKVSSSSGFKINASIQKGADFLNVEIEPSQLTLNDGEYFAVGERPMSYDSRYWGVLKQKDVLGKAYAIY
jgi:conjugal transfer pilin signal peptidase TrbI